MSAVQRIAKNTAVLLVAQVASYLLGFFYLMYTARYLGPASFGILSFALAFTGIFAVLGNLGLGPLTVREVARDKSLAPKYLANVSLMKIILVAVTFGLIALTINLMGYPQETIKAVYLLALLVIFQAFTQMFYSFFQAFERMEFQAIGQILNAALMLVGVIIAMKYSFSIIGFASLYVIAGIITLGYSFAVMKLKFSNIALPSGVKIIEFDWGFWKPTIKEALPFGLTMVFVTIFYWIDTVMLSLMKGDMAVGWYNASYRIVLTLGFIPIAFNSAIFPTMSRFYINSRDSLKESYEKFLKYMIVLGIPIGVGMTLLANRAILLIFGTDYTNSIIALQILVWSMVFLYISSPPARLLESSNKQRVITKIAGGNMLLNVVLNLIFIPKYGYIAASATTVATEFSALILGIMACSKIGYRVSKANLLEIVKAIAASLIMGTLIIYLKGLNLLLLVLLAAITYFLALCIFKGLGKEDAKIFRRAISNKSSGRREKSAKG